MGSSDLGYLLNRAARLFRGRLAIRLADLGLTPQQSSVLIVLASHPEGRMPHRAIAETVGADAATTSGLLGRLERDGWLASRPNPLDGRSREFEVTDKTRDALPEILRHSHEASASASTVLSAEEIVTLRQLLVRLIAQEPLTPSRRRVV